MKAFTFTSGALLTGTLAAGLALAQSTQSTPMPKSTPAAQSSSAPGSGAAGSSESMVGKTDQEFMTRAAKGGMTEVQLAQMAQQKASSQEVKDYARKIEQDHTQANEKLKAIAQERQFQLPADAGPEHQGMASKLNNLSGEEFDRAYVKMMVQDHKKDIKEFERASNRTMDSNLKEFASGTLPKLKEHLSMAEQLSGSTRSRKAPTADSSTSAPAGSSK